MRQASPRRPMLAMRRRRARLPEPTTKPFAVTPLWHVAEVQDQSLRRFPERRHRRRHRARRARGFQLGRASEALHHARHGDRPGQDLQCRRPRDPRRADRPHDPGDRRHARSAAACAGRDRRLRRRTSGQGVPADAADAGPRVGEAAGRRFHRGGGLAARAMVPTIGGNGLAAERFARGDGGAFRRRRLRRLHARQDRADRAGRRRVSRSRLRQHVFDAARRQGALWPDAARGRFRHGRRHDGAARAGALGHVDDDRPCRQR